MDLKESMQQQKSLGNWDLRLIPEFITPDECKNLIGLIDKDLNESTVGLGGEKVVDKSRKSQTAYLCDCSKQVMALKNKIAKELDVNVNQLEGLQGQLYEKDGYFTEHHDAFDAVNIKKFGLHSGNRIKTLMIFLNMEMEGGCTTFPVVDRSFMPLTGCALTWDNLKEDGKIQPAAKHEAERVAYGKKYIVTAWVRENEWSPLEDDLAHEKYLNETKDLPPQYGKAFDIIDTPDEITNLVTAFLMKHKDNVTDEQELHEINGKSRLYNMDNDKTIAQRIHQIYLPIAEKMSGKKLEPTFVYGIRSYGKDTSLKMHRDRKETHAVSFSVTYSADKPWNLVCEGEDLNEYKLDIKPGKSLYYNGSRYLHGRPDKYTGEEYLNFYVHYKIKDTKVIPIKPKNSSHIKMI